MDKEAERLSLIKEARELDLKLQSDEQRMKERVELLNKYNETKDSAQKVLGTLAEKKGISTAKLYKQMKLKPE